MDFTGRVYFSFGEPDVYRFYRLVEAAQAEGTRVGLEWVGIAVGGVPGPALAGDHLATAIAEELRRADPARHAPYVQTLLASVHGEGIDLDHPGLLELVLERVGADPEWVLAPERAAALRAALEASTASATAIGVRGVPSLYRHGPVLLVRTTGAIAAGGATARLRLIADMMDDDGLWELSKP